LRLDRHRQATCLSLEQTERPAQRPTYGVGTVSRYCCQRQNGVFLKKPIVIYQNQDFTPTGIANSKCLAKFTNDCVEKISGEHYFSKSILKQINLKTLNVGGSAWDRTSGPVGINSLTVNCFCSRHNSMLHKLDSEAAKLFATILRFHKELSSGEEYGPHYVLFNYLDIERWLVKALLGASAAKLTKINGVFKGLNSDLIEPYLKFLFYGVQKNVDGAGLYFYAEDNILNIGKTFSFACQESDRTKQVEGCVIGLAGMNLNFSPRKISSLNGKNISIDNYRPWRITFGKTQPEKVIDFSPMVGRKNHKTIHILKKS